jgi:fructosamine-3-kinase
MLQKECAGLRLLDEHSRFHMPKIIAVGEHGSSQFLLLEYLAESSKSSTYWHRFGSRLRALHSVSSADNQYGLDMDNYMGSVTQRNKPCADWTEFFIEHRLKPMVKSCVNRQQLDASDSSRFASLFSRLEDLYPSEKPALLHGDLWSGNVMTDSHQAATLIDPAVYFGHREVDIAMTCLFGGFSEEFYQSYNEVQPLESGWQERVDLWNLYPLLIHLHLFGSQYLSQVKSALHKFT